MSAASLPPVGIDPNLRNKSGSGSGQLKKWRNDFQTAKDRHNAAKPFFIQEQQQEFAENTKRYQEELRRKEADRQSKSKEFVATTTATNIIAAATAAANNGSTGLLHGGGSSYIPPAATTAVVDVVAPTPPVSRKRRAGDPIQTTPMDYHGAAAAAAAQMFQRGGPAGASAAPGQMGSCSGMFPMSRLPPNGSLAVYPGVTAAAAAGYPNAFAHMMPQTSQHQQQQQQQQQNSVNMMPIERVPSEPLFPDPKSVATPPLYANPSPSTSTPLKHGLDASNNSPPNDPTPGSSSQTVAGDGCQLTDCLNVADDHEKTLDDMIKSSLANELTDLGGSIHNDLEDMELTSLLDRIGDLIPVEEPTVAASSAPPSAPTVPTSNDNSPIVPGPMSAPGAFNSIASPASVRSNATPAPSVQTVPVVPQHHSPYGAIAPTPPMNNGNMAFSPPAPQSQVQTAQNPTTGGFPMQSPQFAAAQGVQQTPAGYPNAMTIAQMHQQQQQQHHQQQQYQHFMQMKAAQAAHQQQMMHQQHLMQKQMMLRMQQQQQQQFNGHPGYPNQGGYNLPMQYPQGMPQQNYHPHHHYPPTGYPMG